MEEQEKIVRDHVVSLIHPDWYHYYNFTDIIHDLFKIEISDINTTLGRNFIYNAEEIFWDICNGVWDGNDSIDLRVSILVTYRINNAILVSKGKMHQDLDNLEDKWYKYLNNVFFVGNLPKIETEKIAFVSPLCDEEKALHSEIISDSPDSLKDLHDKLYTEAQINSNEENLPNGPDLLFMKFWKTFKTIYSSFYGHFVSLTERISHLRWPDKTFQNIYSIFDLSGNSERTPPSFVAELLKTLIHIKNAAISHTDKGVKFLPNRKVELTDFKSDGKTISWHDDNFDVHKLYLAYFCLLILSRGYSRAALRYSLSLLTA